MEPPCRLPVRETILDAAVPGLPGCLREFLPLPAKGQVLVPGDLAQPHPYLALSPEAVDGGKGPDKGFLGHFLRRLGIPAQSQHIAVHVRKIRPVDRFKVRHSLTPSTNRTPPARIRYSIYRKKAHCFSTAGII